MIVMEGEITGLKNGRESEVEEGWNVVWREEQWGVCKDKTMYLYQVIIFKI